MIFFILMNNFLFYIFIYIHICVHPVFFSNKTIKLIDISSRWWGLPRFISLCSHWQTFLPHLGGEACYSTINWVSWPTVCFSLFKKKHWMFCTNVVEFYWHLYSVHAIKYLCLSNVLTFLWCSFILLDTLIPFVGMFTILRYLGQVIIWMVMSEQLHFFRCK